MRPATVSQRFYTDRLSSVIAAVGGVLYTVRGNTHAFFLSDPRLSYPFIPDTVPYQVAAVVAVVIPAVFIAALSLLFNPPPVSSSSSSPSTTWRRKLWSWHAGWLGLGVSLAGSFFVTSALKDVVGKPRPNLLARCDPDISQLSTWAVSGFGLGDGLSEAPVLVTAGICRNGNTAIVQDGFAAFPSGHSSFAVSGLLYFSLWLCARFGAAIPSDAASNGWWRVRRPGGPETRAAAPPLYLLVAGLIPLAGAAYICASRWADNQHDGWDILSGAAIGAFFAWLGYRWYHPPLQNLPGTPWSLRSKTQAFYGGPAVDARREWRENEGEELGPV